MKKRSHTLLAMLICITPLLSSATETNAHIEVKLFKDWIIKNDKNFGNLAIRNTGTTPILLAKDASIFESFQLHSRSLPDKRTGYIAGRIERDFQMLRSMEEYEFFNLLPGETHVYEGCKFYLPVRSTFAEEMSFLVSIYLGNDFWLDSKPLTVKGIVPDSVEQLSPVRDNSKNQDQPRNMTAITYKNERWLYYSNVYPICPLSLDGKIRIEPHDGAGLFKIWDGDKSMIFDMYHGGVIVEGPDENNVFGKWTRERKQKADADNAEVRRKKAEQQ